MTIFDRLVEDKNFYIRVQKIKLILVSIGLIYFLFISDSKDMIILREIFWDIIK